MACNVLSYCDIGWLNSHTRWKRKKIDSPKWTKKRHKKPDTDNWPTKANISTKHWNLPWCLSIWFIGFQFELKTNQVNLLIICFASLMQKTSFFVKQRQGVVNLIFEHTWCPSTIAWVLVQMCSHFEYPVCNCVHTSSISPCRERSRECTCPHN